MNDPSSNSFRGPHVISDVALLRQALGDARAANQTIGLVPTMGALHEGHLSLVRRSLEACDVTVVTIFVNPTQFGPQEDFARYARVLDADLALLSRERTDVVFAPAAETIYPPGFSTYVDPPHVAQPLEGRCRPGHFRGVTTVVLKLFHLIPADVAYFGQKDYQQCRVIEQMVRDLDLPLRIEVCPTVREQDGLAMSSRNRYLTAAQREQSLSLYRALRKAAQLLHQETRCARTLCDEMRATLCAGGVTQIDYAALVDPQTLQEVDQANDDTMALLAAHVGNTRLIDNCRLGDMRP